MRARVLGPHPFVCAHLVPNDTSHLGKCLYNAKGGAAEYEGLVD